MKKTLKIIVSMSMVLVLLVCSSIPAFAATSGKVSDGKYCTVKIDKSLRDQYKPGSKIQYATVKLEIRDQLNKFTNSGKVRIVLRDGNGKWLCEWDAKGGDTFKLGNDHSTYRIYVYYYSSGKKDAISKANDFTNMGKTVNWKIVNPKSCTIS